MYPVSHVASIHVITHLYTACHIPDYNHYKENIPAILPVLEVECSTVRHSDNLSISSEWATVQGTSSHGQAGPLARTKVTRYLQAGGGREHSIPDREIRSHNWLLLLTFLSCQPYKSPYKGCGSDCYGKCPHRVCLTHQCCCTHNTLCCTQNLHHNMSINMGGTIL